ncbi:class II aldolase/adducin family protein [bacterium]|nr:class II aldolase/adducin family protein [bacterium]
MRKETRKWGTPEDESGLSESEIRDLMCEIGHRLWVKDMAAANDGNISCRLDEQRILTTPTMISKGFMDPEDLVVVDMDGRQVSGKRKVTSEVRMHLLVYRERNDVRAAVHAHPRHALAFAATHTAPPPGVLNEVEYVLGEIALVPYALAGTQEFADALAPFIGLHQAFLIAHHGALTLGEGLIEAFWRMETLENYCAMLLAADPLGGVKRISDERLREILENKKKMGLFDGRCL